MRIVKNTIIFNSTDENYYKEYNGWKPNTIRRIPIDEIKLFMGFKYKLNIDSKIMIINKKTGDFFERYITDITMFEGYYIISWKA